jgi:DNA-binding transcriptional LysR family regulator
MNLSQLRAIVAVADCHTFSEAALSLNLSQSTVSHAIADLETELGILLFKRGRHGATPTPAGEQIVEYARQVLQLLELMQREANRQKGLQGGEVRIASFRSAATNVLPAAIAHFREQFPAIEIKLIECLNDSAVEQALREGRADLGFIELPTSEEFETWEILRDPFVVLGRVLKL